MAAPRQANSPMQFRSKVFQLAKDPERADENQDAYRIEAAAGVAAIADGVASGIFCRGWARILAEAVVDDDLDPNDRGRFNRWLAERRRAWQEQIDVSSLAWFQKPKLRQGAFSTLLWVRLEQAEPKIAGGPEAWRLRTFAIGDSCLFLFREGRMLRAFPIEHAEQLEADPLAIGSIDLGRDELIVFESLEEPCREGDLVVLCTDAVAAWVLNRQQSGSPPDWQRYWHMAEADWHEEVGSLRHQRQMRYDDATLVLLGVCREASPATGCPATAAAASEPLEQEHAGPEDHKEREADVEDGEPAPSPAPPLLPGGGDWSQRLRHLSEQVADEVSQQLSRGVKKLKDAKESAQSALKKYRAKLRDGR